VVTVSKQLPPFLSKSGEDASSSSRSFMDEVCIPGATALKVELDKRYLIGIMAVLFVKILLLEM